ncbi:hypothetical protein PALB_27480 [Pseudoalteromonas luteoviolacea B = ATCC 29581]|nr:hypothetical protein PALB_27480 [Pseudoalteromonas luteoviolacea B = ATCC 29581]
MNKLQFNINITFFISIYLCCAVVYLLSASQEKLTFLAKVLSFVVSIYFILSVLERRKVIFYDQGVYYDDLFGLPCYIPFEQIVNVKIISIFGLKVTKVNLTKSTLWFFAFKPDSKQIKIMKSFGYKLSGITR